MISNWTRTLPAVLPLLLVATTASAQEAGGGNSAGLGVGILMGLAVLGGGMAQGYAARGALEGISRNPQAAGKIQTPMLIGLAFIESLVIFAFVISFLLSGKA
jgi:F-type H+-transporting ATPase subunit c